MKRKLKEYDELKKEVEKLNTKNKSNVDSNFNQ